APAAWSPRTSPPVRWRSACRRAWCAFAPVRARRPPVYPKESPLLCARGRGKTHKRTRRDNPSGAEMSDNQVIIGINAFHGDASAAGLAGGTFRVGVEEERFTRVKQCAGSPERSIR